MRPDARAHTFPAMGGVVEMQVVGGDAMAPLRVEQLFERYERVMSRFLADSELSRLNAAAGAPFVATPVLFDAVAAALAWAERTDGIFDPTVIDLLEAHGYDRPFDAGPGPVREPRGRSDWRAIALDAATRTIRLPRGTRLDLGGIGKGFAVDRALAMLGPGANAFVNASGDLRAAGNGPEGEGWRVGVAHPRSPDDDVAVLVVRDRAVATSGAVKRNWRVGAERYHHLIDVRAGRPARSDLLTVTVVADTAESADVLASVVFLLGSRDGLDLAQAHGADVIGIRDDGRIVTTPTLAAVAA
jgi:thiamine biosynthesis lipoprotein